MKIGILTFHYTINQGSVIQAYSVQNLLQEQFPDAKVEVINLVPFMREKYELQFYNKKFPFISLQKIKKYRSIRKFVKRYLNLSPRVHYNSLDRQIAYINKQNYDIIFTGSDTVWFDSKKLNNQIPNIYFLPNELKAKKISIAASLDPILDERAYTRKSEKLKSIFNSYELITVRDNKSHELISKLSDKKIEIIADPTILFDFEKKLKFKINNNPITETKKTIAIGITDKKLAGLLHKKLANQYAVSNMINSKSIQFDYIFDELNSYSKYDVVITDRFHRSIFTLKLSNALVINVERSNKNKTENSKGRDLFQKIGLTKHFLRYDEGENDAFFDNLQKIIKSWDNEAYENRKEKLNAYIKKEKKHWQNLIGSINI